MRCAPYLTYLNAWCELRSPAQQVGESQPRTAELFIEPDAKVVQPNSRRQTSLQPRHVVGALSAKAESVVQLFVDGLYDLADGKAAQRLSRLGHLLLRALRLGGQTMRTL
jgi:hypothetical protein